MSLHNPSLRELKGAVNAHKQAEKIAKDNLINAVKNLKEKRKTESEILTYIVKNTGLDLDNAKKFLKYNF